MSDPMAFVGSDGAGKFSAHIDYGDARPFRFLNGPHAVDAGVAVAWARERASKVLIRVENEMFSGGTEPIPGIPRWPVDVRSHAVRDNSATAPWRVRGTTTLLRGDPVAAAGELARALDRDARASQIRVTRLDRRLELALVVEASGELAAQEAASAVLRDAWDASELDDVHPGDYDASEIVVQAMKPSAH